MFFLFFYEFPSTGRDATGAFSAGRRNKKGQPTLSHEKQRRHG
jgi:hypothetical protein